MGSDSTDKASAWTASHGINLHKLLVTPVTAGLMWYYSCYTPAAWTYLSLHGTYSLLWLAKEACFPDKTFREPMSFGVVAFIFVLLNIQYYSIPWALCYHAKTVPEWFQTIAISVYTIGMFLMVGSDCQKYFLLQAQPGKLITTGFFKHIRSPNYLGEILIYTAFSMLTYTPWGYLGNLSFVLLAVIPSLARKDKSMSRYPEFKAYKASTSALIPLFY
eukprot:g14216.t1